MVFLVKETLTEEDRAAWRRLAVQRERTARKKHRKEARSWLVEKIGAIFDIAWGLLILWAVAHGMAAGWVMAGWVTFALMLLVAGPWMFIKAGRCPVQEPVSMRDFPPSGVPDKPVRAAFFEDCRFVFWEDGVKTRLGYQAVTGAWEDQERFYLFFADRPPLVLPKRGLGRWMPEEFRDFLERELEVSVERI